MSRKRGRTNDILSPTADAADDKTLFVLTHFSFRIADSVS